MAATDTHSEDAAAEQIDSFLKKAKGLTWTNEARQAPFAAGKAVSFALQTVGTLHPLTAKAFNGLGTIFHALGALKEALMCHQEELAIRVKIFGANHLETSIALHNVGFILNNYRRWREALPYFAEALAIRQSQLGPNHIACGITLAQMAESLAATGRPSEARSFLDRALVIHIATFGAEHPAVNEVKNALEKLPAAVPFTGSIEDLVEEERDVPWGLYGNGGPEAVTRVSEVAMLMGKLGDPAGSAAYWSQAVALSRELLGNGSPQTADALEELGGALATTGDHASARACFDEALKIRQAAYGPHHEMVGRTLDRLAWLMREKGDLKSACVFLEQELSILRQTRGNEDPQTGACLQRLGVFSELTDQHSRARMFLEEALPLCKRHLGERHLTVAETDLYLGTALCALRQFTAARDRLDEALSIRREQLGPKHIEVARVLVILSTAASGLHDPRAARSHLQEAWEIYRQEPNASVAEREATQIRLARLLGKAGEFSAAKIMLDEAIARRTQTLGQNHPETLFARRQLGELFLDAGHFKEARETFEPLLGAARKMFGEKHPQTADLLCNLGIACGNLGDYASARPLLEKSLAIRKEVLGEANPDTAQSLHHLAYTLEDTGDYAGAVEKYSQALAIRRTALGPDHDFTVATLNNIAVLLKTMRRYSEAQDYYQAMLDSRRRVYGEEHIQTARAMVNTGAFLHAIQQFEPALRLLEKSLEIQRRLAGDDPAPLAATLHNLGALATDMGDFTKARRCFEEALDLTRRTRSEGSVQEFSSLRAMAWMHEKQTDHAQAFSVLEQAAKVQDHILGHSFAAGSERQRKASVLMPLVVLHEVLTLVLRHFPHDKKCVRSAFDLVLRRKGITAEALAMQRDGVLGGRYPGLQSKLSELTARRAEMAHLQLDGPGSQDQEAYRRQIAGLQQDRERLEAELAQLIPELKMDERLRAIDCDRIASAIPASHALVEFVRYTECSFRLRKPEEGPEPLRYVAFVLPAGQPENLQMVDLGEAGPIDNWVGALRAAESRAAPSRHFATDDEPAVSGQEDGVSLRKAIFDPLLDSIDTCRRLILGADGRLLFLPFEILPVNGEARLIDEWHFCYVSAARDLLRMQQRSGRAPGPAFIAADPNYNLRASVEAPRPEEPAPSPTNVQRDLGRGGTFQPLPEGRIEGERIAELLKVKGVFDDAVTKTRVTGTRSPSILHLATHGFFLESRGSASSMPMDLTDRMAQISQQVENPLLRSGMALAGANAWLKFQPLPPEAGNGILTAEDVTGLDLIDTDLVVLSACETGLGAEDLCEGVMGLRRSFALAGARTIVISLWKVPDDQTEDLMVDFYQRALNGTTKADALREAQLAIKEKFPSPFFWGAFICQGDPGPLQTPETQ